MLVPITGREKDIDTKNPIGALAEFYHAFNARSFQLLELNWIGDGEVSMESGVGGIERGWSAIARIYDLAIRGKRIVTLELHDYSFHPIGETFLAIGAEHGRLTSPEGDLDFVILISRWFTKAYGRWRQVHYHGSIDDAATLARFQSLMGAGAVKDLLSPSSA